MRLLMLRLKRGDGTGQNVDSAAWKKKGRERKQQNEYRGKRGLKRECVNSRICVDCLKKVGEVVVGKEKKEYSQTHRPTSIFLLLNTFTAVLLSIS